MQFVYWLFQFSYRWIIFFNEVSFSAIFVLTRSSLAFAALLTFKAFFWPSIPHFYDSGNNFELDFFICFVAVFTTFFPFLLLESLTYDKKPYLFKDTISFTSVDNPLCSIVVISDFYFYANFRYFFIQKEIYNNSLERYRKIRFYFVFYFWWLRILINKPNLNSWKTSATG